MTKKSAAAIVRSPLGPDRAHLGVEHERERRQLGGRVGMGERAADRALVAVLRMRDVQRARRAASGGGAFTTGDSSTVRWRVIAPIASAAALLAHVVEAVHLREVDQDGGPREAHVEERDQALAARQQLRLALVLLRAARPPRRASAGPRNRSEAASSAGVDYGDKRPFVNHDAHRAPPRCRPARRPKNVPSASEMPLA